MQEIMLFIQHHILLNAALLAVLFALVVLEFINQKRSASKASPAEVTRLMNHANANVVDVRTPAQYAAGHIIGSLSIPLSELADNNKKLDKLRVQPIILVCANGIDSARTATTLINQGYNVRILAGGIRSWTDAEMPLVKE